MDNQQGISIFFEEKHTETLQQHNSKEAPLPESLPYLKHGDSSQYLEQFLAKDEPQPEAKAGQQLQKKEQSGEEPKDEDFSISEKAKCSPSSFHNFQKHLTVCLRHIVQIKPDLHHKKDYQEVAARLWKIFQQSTISTKKALHYLLGERNQHKITDSALKQFGLLKIYEEYSEKVLKQARGYLANETLKQIRAGKLATYIQSKKLKYKQKFRKYAESFVEELEQGFLRKRLPKDRVYEMERC